MTARTRAPWYMSEPRAPRMDWRLARLAELDRQIAARAAVLEAQAGSDRAKFLRLLRSDRALEELKLEHDIGYQLLPEALRAGQREYLDEAAMKKTSSNAGSGRQRDRRGRAARRYRHCDRGAAMSGRKIEATATLSGEGSFSADDLFLMVNLRGRSTGLPMNVWIGPKGRARHAARIKVQIDHGEQFNIGNLAVVSVEDDPPQVKEGSLSADDLALVRRYIALNKQAILDHWREHTDGSELVRVLKRLP